MDAQVLRERLGGIANYEDFLEVVSLFSQQESAPDFEVLWPIAIGCDECAEMAGYILAQLQPDTDQSIEKLLAQVHSSDLDASNRIVPFYLVCQFGRPAVARAAFEFVKSLPPTASRSKVDAVRYWASLPASELCKGFHGWEFRDTYEIAGDE